MRNLMKILTVAMMVGCGAYVPAVEDVAADGGTTPDAGNTDGGDPVVCPANSYPEGDGCFCNNGYEVNSEGNGCKLILSNPPDAGPGPVPGVYAPYGFAPSGAPYVMIRVTTSRSGVLEVTDRYDGAWSGMSMPSSFPIDPCDHNNLGRKGIEVWVKTQTGKYCGCDDMTCSSMDIAMFAMLPNRSDRSLGGEHLLQTQSCRGERRVNRLILASDLLVGNNYTCR